MKLVAPKPFFFEGGKRGVLLLHGFTGSSADVRMLGRFLQKQGYSCLAPQYKGHGVPPEELLLTGPEDWWEDVLDGYRALQDKGYNEIAVAGLSLGGVFSLKLGLIKELKGIVPMCAPMHIKSVETMYDGVLNYAREYKKREQKQKDQIDQEMDEFKKTPMNTLQALQDFIAEVRKELDMLYTPTFVIQARHDEMINTDNANIIHNTIESDYKKLKWYEESTHVITLAKEKNQLHKDILTFLDELNWSN